MTTPNQDNISKESPFAALFQSSNQTKLFTPQDNNIEMNSELASVSQKMVLISDLLERIFLLSVDTDVVTEERKLLVPACSTFMHEFLNPESLLKSEEIERMVFDRLMLTDLESRLLIRHANKSTKLTSDIPSEHPLTYLWACYERSLCERHSTLSLKTTLTQAKKIIVENICTMLTNPDIFSGVFEVMTQLTPIHQQFWNLIIDSNNYETNSTFHALMADISNLAEDDQTLTTIFSPFFNKQCATVTKLGLDDFLLAKHIKILVSMTSFENLASLVVTYRHVTNGIMNSILKNSIKTLPAILLGKTSLYMNNEENDRFYDNPLQSHAGVEDQRAHLHLEDLHSNLFNLFHNLVRKSKNDFLSWLGELMQDHAHAAKLWTHEQTNAIRSVFTTDAVFLNLASVLVRLALPFCVTKNGTSNGKWLKIDPSYCVATGANNRVELGVHMKGLDTETCIISTSENKQPIPLSSSYNFITECFFLTHRALYLGMHGLLVKFNRLDREMNRLQNMLRNSLGTIPDSETRELIKNRFKRGMSVFLSIKGTLSEPEFVSNFIRFQLTTACYLNQISFTTNRSEAIPVPLPLTSQPPDTLKHLPEFIVENLVDFLIFCKRHQPSALEDLVKGSDTLLTLISVFMGNQTRMSNPHLRATLADVLEAILPIEEHLDEDNNFLDATIGFKHTNHLTVSVFQLFVDIEFTGDPHQFEQKFNYRRPLYSILKFLWQKESGRNAAKKLALQSIDDIEASSPPLMLRFINLFLNDSVYLLDEAIVHLSNIKSEEEDRAQGRWESLSPEEKAEKEQSLEHMVMNCRYHNVMSNKTVETLAYMSTEEEIIKLLCHSVLVERIAGMLNYFLEHLVGPKMKDLKVQDFSHCEFKPKELVSLICKIYTNLSDVNEFCRAVSQDGRSYSRELFPRAIRVLNKIGSIDLIDGIQKISDQALVSTSAGISVFNRRRKYNFFRFRNL